MKKIIAFIEKGKPFFEKVSRNIYLGAIRDGFLAAMPVILFSSIFILLAAVPNAFNFYWTDNISKWLWKIYGYTMGVVALLVSSTTARSLTDSINRKMPKNNQINAVSTMMASMVGFLLLSVSQIDGGFSTSYMGTKGLLAAFTSAFISVNAYKVCVKNNITIKMPKEVPGTISQTFKDVIPFGLSVIIMVVLDSLAFQIFGTTFAEAIIKLFQPLFSAADGYVGIALIWGAMAMFWFVGVHGPSIVEPAIAAIIYANVDTNLQLFTSGQQANKVLTVGLGNFVGTMGGTGATFVVPFLFLLFAKSKQLKAVGKASVIPVCFAVNEPLLFGAPIILNPVLFIPFIVTPMVNVCLFKFFVDVWKMNSFMYVLPWATPAPLGLVLGTGFGVLSFVLVALLLVVDFIIYFPFVKAYDQQLLELELKNADDEADKNDSRGCDSLAAVTKNDSQINSSIKEEMENKNVLVLCAGAGTSAMLANSLKEGAEEYNLPITSAAGAYGSHYEIMKDFDLIILAPQVASYYQDIKEDADKLNMKLVATKGVEYIKLTRDPKKAIEFVLEQFK